MAGNAHQYCAYMAEEAFFQQPNAGIEAVALKYKALVALNLLPLRK
ncbi:MAG: hypothetical protein RL341_2578 [Pseudomonadota bacterium]